MEKNFFSNVWLHSKKCSRKNFKRLGCVSNNALENMFSISFSHFSQLSNKYYNKKIPGERERERERDPLMCGLMALSRGDGKEVGGFDIEVAMTRLWQRR